MATWLHPPSTPGLDKSEHVKPYLCQKMDTTHNPYPLPRPLFLFCGLYSLCRCVEPT